MMDTRVVLPLPDGPIKQHQLAGADVEIDTVERARGALRIRRS